MGFLDKLRAKNEETINYNKGMEILGYYLQNYTHILNPFFGSEEFVRRLIDRVYFTAERDDIKLDNKSLDGTFRETVKRLEGFQSGLEALGQVLSDGKEAEIIDDTLNKFYQLIKEEEKYPMNARILNKQEAIKFVRWIIKIMEERKHFWKKRREDDREFENTTLFGRTITKLKNINITRPKGPIQDYVDFYDDREKNMHDAEKYINKSDSWTSSSQGNNTPTELL